MIKKKKKKKKNLKIKNIPVTLGVRALDNPELGFYELHDPTRFLFVISLK